MTTPEILALAAILLLVGFAAAYIIYAKKKGRRCIGCSGQCSSCGNTCPAHSLMKEATEEPNPSAAPTAEE